MSQILDEIQRAREGAARARWWDLAVNPPVFARPPTDEERARLARDAASAEHDRASAARAGIHVTPEATATDVQRAEQRLINTRSVFYAADAKLAALVREADVKAKIEEVEAAKKQTLADVEDVIDELDEEDNSIEHRFDRDWGFLDEMGERDLIASVKGVLRAYRERVVAS